MRLVFVSSTFKDMQFERDELNTRLAPRINDFLSKYGESIRFGDLRWGVNTSDLESEESSKKVLRVCLDEINNARPYMIVFIGERYGWIPSGDLLREAMKTRDIEDVPDDISVTNLEIEYGALLQPDYEGRVLFYFRKPFDDSEMGEEERRNYASESPLHKKKLDDLKKKILELYPDYVRYYDVSYDSKQKKLVGLDSLMEQVYEDLTRIFDIDFRYLNSLPPYQRAIQNSEVYFESFSRYAYRRANLADPWNPESELSENYSDGRYEDVPCLRYVTAAPGMGRKTTIACLYEQAKESNPDYVLPFAFGLDRFTKDKDSLIATLISFYEEKLSYSRYKSNSIATLADLIRYNDEHDRHHFQIFILNYHKDIIVFLKELELAAGSMLHTTFYIMGNRESPDYVPFLAFYGHSDYIELNEEETSDEEKEEIIRHIVASKRKELSPVVIQRILAKERSGVPLYLALVVERLLMLDNSDFAAIRHLGDGMEAINAYMISVVDNLGDDVRSVAKTLFLELAKRINFDLVMRLLYLASHDCNLTLDEYRSFFAFANLPYSELDCSLLYNTIPSLFAPVSIYNDLSFAFVDGMEAAKELSEEYVDKDFHKIYLDYLDYLGQDYLTAFKKLVVLREQDDVPGFYEVYRQTLSRQKMEADAEIVNNAFVSLMDNLMTLFYLEEDDFLSSFLRFALDKIILDEEEARDHILSVLFYPYIFGALSQEYQARSIAGLAEITSYLRGKFGDEKGKKSSNLTLVAGLLNYLNYAVLFAHYDDCLEDSDEYRSDAYALSSLIDNDLFDRLLKDSSLRQAYYVFFLDRAKLEAAVEHIPHKSHFAANAHLYRPYIEENLRFDVLKETLINEDFISWIEKAQIKSVIALFYDLMFAKHFGTAIDYQARLGNYLQVADRILQNDFFNQSRCTLHERVYIEPLFQSFAALLKEEGVDSALSFDLGQWLLETSRKFCSLDPANTAYVRVYASVLSERGDGAIPDEDFFFLYPLLFKRLQRAYDSELFLRANQLLCYTSSLYENEIDVEFLSLLSLFHDHGGDLSIAHMHLAVLLKLRNRGMLEDDLITNSYAIWTEDYELADENAYNVWKQEHRKAVSKINGE